MSYTTSLSKLFGEGQTQPETFEYNDISINRTHHTVHVQDRLVHLDYKEFQLLWLLMEYEGAVVRFSEIQDYLWGPKSVPLEFVHAYVERLKFKLGSVEGALIQEVPEIGFRIDGKPKKTVAPINAKDFMKFRLLFRHY